MSHLRRPAAALTAALCLFAAPAAYAAHQSGHQDGPARSAAFNGLAGVAVDDAGNAYIADAGNACIRKISPTGDVSTLAGDLAAHTRGHRNGLGAEASFDVPNDVAVDHHGNVYVADTNNHCIRKITPDGHVTTLAGNLADPEPGSRNGRGATAAFNSPSALTVDRNGNVFVADSDNNCIRKITPKGEVTTFAGSTAAQGNRDGQGGNARFNVPSGIAVDARGYLYVGDTGNRCIRKISPSGMVTTLAGNLSHPDSGNRDGQGPRAAFGTPANVALDRSGNLYVADVTNQCIRKVSPDGDVTTLAGNLSLRRAGKHDGLGKAATFNGPGGLAVDPHGMLLVADGKNDLVRRVTPSGTVTTYAGQPTPPDVNGVGQAASFDHPTHIASDGRGNLYVSDSDNECIRKISASGVVTTWAGDLDTYDSGTRGGRGTAARFDSPQGLAFDHAGNLLVCDSNNESIRKIDPDADVTLLAGQLASGAYGCRNGLGKYASFYDPEGIAVDGGGNAYIADTLNYCIRKISPAGTVSAVAGDSNDRPDEHHVLGYINGAARSARFDNPTDVAVAKDGTLFVADWGNDVIRKISRGGEVSTFAGAPTSARLTLGYKNGSGTNARFAGPAALAMGRGGDLFVVDKANNCIRKVTPAGVVTTLAGDAHAQARKYQDGTGTEARFNAPSGITIDAAGNLFVADTDNNCIRKVTPAGVVTTVAGLPKPGAD